MTVINFDLSSDKKIRVTVPDWPDKINYYYEPTKKLHKFDEATVAYIESEINIELTKDIIDVIMCRFYESLKKAVNADTLLPHFIRPGDLGYVLNRALNGLEEIDISPYWLWSSSKNMQVLLYNSSNKIYLEVVPSYPWTFLDPLPGDHYMSFEEFMKNYQPYVVEIIPMEIAIQWKDQCNRLLDSINSTCIRHI